MEPLLSKYQCGFRRGFSAKTFLLGMLGKCKLLVDKGKAFGVLLTYVYKAFDCLSHELIIAKLSAYGFSLYALKLMQSYLTERNHGLKSTKLIVLGTKHFSVCAKDLYLVRFYLFILLLNLQVMLMTTQFIM